MKEIAERQEISLKYIERILPDITKGDIIEGIHGKGGGYRLKKPPEEITVGEILRLTEGDLAPVACLAESATPCEKKGECRTIKMWSDYADLTNKFFDSITVAQLTKKDSADYYVI